MPALAKAAERGARDFCPSLIDGDDPDADILDEIVDVPAALDARVGLDDHRLEIRGGRNARPPVVDNGVHQGAPFRFIEQDGDERGSVDDDQSNSPSLL
jgi:hypothetical protein